MMMNSLNPTPFQRARTGPKRIEAAEFLTALFGPYYGRAHSGFIEIRLIAPRRVKSYFFRGLQLLRTRRFHAKNCHTFYGLLPRESRQGKKDSVRWLLALWADLDAKDFPEGKEGAWRRLQGFERPASVIVDSGNGLQALWLLMSPVEIQDPEMAEGLLRGLARSLGGDPAVSDIARVFRLPGSYNVKDPLSPKLVKVKFFSPSTRYELSDFEPIRVSAPASSRTGEAEGIRPESSEGLPKVLACKFVRFAEANARTLPEPLWWALLTNLLPFKGGRMKAHEFSRPYERGRNRYSFRETERKIEHILKSSPGPHTCRRIVEYGYPCSFVGTCPVDSPAGLAWAEDEFVEGLRKEPYEIETQGGSQP